MKKINYSMWAVLFLLFAACNKGTDTQQSDGQHKRITIGMSFQEMNNPYFVVMREAFEEAVRSIGGTAYTADARHDVTKQINDIEDMIQKEIDILIINPTDTEGVKGAVDSAKAAGVIVVAVDAQAAGVNVFVGSRNYDAGVQAGEALAQGIGGSGEVAILNGIPVVPILERVRGFKDAIAKYPNIEIVNIQNGKQARDVALSVTENMLQAAPDLKGIFSVNDEGSLGSLAAIEASGREIKLTSVDGAPEAVKAIAKGGPFIATSAQFPRDMIRIGLGMALAQYWGARVVPATVPLNVKLVDKNTAATFSW